MIIGYNQVRHNTSFQSTHLSANPSLHLTSGELQYETYLHCSRTAFHHKMPSKTKRAKVPQSRNHPSQSSVDVPLRIKEDVKKLQDMRCWLCDCKAHKTLRPLEICHVYPQATSKRFPVRLQFNPLRHGRLQNRSSWYIISWAAYSFITSMINLI